VYAISIAVFLFWILLYPYHLGKIEQSNWFVFDALYFDSFFLKPGGISAYLGSFVSQFYINVFAGAFLQTLFFVLVARLVHKIVALSEGDMRRLCGSLLSSLLFFALQCEQAFTPAYSLAFIFYFTGIYIYGLIHNRAFRFFAFALLIPVFYLLIGGGLLCGLYSAIALYEIIRRRGTASLLSLILLAGAIYTPHLWKGLYLTPDSDLYSLLPHYPSGRSTGAFALMLSLPFILVMRHLIPLKSQAFSLCVNLVAAAAGLIYFFPSSYNAFREQKFGMYSAIREAQWDRAISIRTKLKQSDELTDYMYDLALAAKGELPEKLFDYPRDKKHSLFLQRNLEQDRMLYGSEFYYRVGLLNEAIHWIAEASAESGMNIVIMNRLARWNAEAGYKVADKYYSLLDCTLFYKGLDRPSEEKAPDNGTDTSMLKDFFIGGRETVSDLARHLDNSPSNRITLDYMLCELLIKKDFQRFSKLFEICYGYKDGDSLPRAYSEAFMILAALTQDTGLINRVSPEVRRAYSEYMQLYQSKSTRQIKDKYSKSLWYHVHFTK
jgi:hypothetical protein